MKFMKKLGLLSILCVLACSLFVACSDDDDDDFFGPKNKWCMKQFEYSQDTQENQNVRTVAPTSAKLTCYFFYSDGTSYANTSKLVPRKQGNDWSCLSKAGLTVVILGSSDSSIAQTLGNNKFFVQTLSEGDSFNEDGEKGTDEKSFKFKMNSKLWTAICLLNKELIQSATPEIPASLKKDDAATTQTWSEFTNPIPQQGQTEQKPTFNFKKIAKQFLIQKLLEE